MTCRDKIVSEEYIDWIIDFPLEELFETVSEDLDFCYQRVDGNIGIVSLNKNQMAEESFALVDYQFYPELLGLQIDSEGMPGELFNPLPLIASGVTEVQDNPLNLTGRGVIVGFIDTGINWKNRVFRREDGSTRILSIWDQTDQSGQLPNGFLYGSEYTQDMLNQALMNDELGSNDDNGHGTAIASVACGSILNGGVEFLSPAYQSDIIMVKVKPCKEYLRDYYLVPERVNAYQSSDIMMAIKYIDGFARAFQRPVVICIGMGSNYGEHAGNGILSRYIDSICEKRSRAVVIAGGNEGNARHHFRGELTGDSLSENVINGNAVKRMEIDVSAENKGFLMQIWASVPSNLSFSLQAPSGEMIRPTPVLFQKTLRYRFIYEKTTITVYNTRIDQNSGEALILVRFEKPSVGIWTLEVKDENLFPKVRFDAWLPISEFLEGEVTFLESEIDTTMTTPSYAREAITTSTYNSYNNSFYLSSGRGYGRGGEIKPDVASPGVNISAVSNRLGERIRISNYTGSSMAVGILAGIAAEFMQWAVIDGNAPYIRSNELKNYLISGAKREGNMYYPNPQWGFGKVDISGVFTFLSRCLVVALLGWNI